VTPARAAYTVFAFFAVPFAALYLLWRSRRQPEYRQHWSERFGFKHYAPDAARPTIWIHAVSLGETRAAEPLIDALAQRYPHLHFLLTHMTPTGRAAGADVAARWPDRVMQTYLPYDLPYAIRRFLRAFKPVAGVTIETEIWPNLMAIAAEAGVPMALVNARLSERSYQSYRRFAQLMRDAAARFKWVLAQTEADSARLRKLGANEVEVTGNIKFDSAPDQVLVARGAAWRRACGRPVWLFASTRDSEEALILSALPAEPDAVVIIVPRHPQRFDEVARLIEARGLVAVRRSTTDNFVARSDREILLGDSMGEMAMYYAAADVALIGGSVANLGGQNLIEACAVGTPVVVGPHTFNFEEATLGAIEAGAGVRVANAAEAITAMAAITRDTARRARMSEAGVRFAQSHRGATMRTLERLAPIIDAWAGSVAAGTTAESSGP